MISLAIAANPSAEISLLGSAHSGEIQFVKVGDKVRLGPIGQKSREVHFSWHLDRRPKGSTARISKHNSRRTSFRADVPGRYVIRLTVRFRNLHATATFSVTASDPAPGPPLVSVNTIDTSQGTPATVIGGYAHTDPTNGTGLHVVVVDRGNTKGLALVNGGNTGYPLTSDGIQDMQSYFETLPADGSILVLVSMPASAVTIPSNLMAPLSTALNTIGGLIPESWTLGDSNAALQTCWSSMMMQCFDNSAQWVEAGTGWEGSFSVIGVPGMAIGTAWYGTPRPGATEGTLAGYLTPGAVVGGGENSSAYVFVFGADQYVTVDTCASGWPSACVIKVGGQSFPPKNGIQNGMTVVLLDRVTLAPLLYQTVTSTNELYSNLFYTITKWSSGHFFFGPYNANPLSDSTIVILQSVGNGGLTFSPIATGDTGTALLQAIDQVGGTPETFARAIIQEHPYALVGVASNLPWHGKAIESSQVISTTQYGRSRGVLSRDRYARYTPTTSDPVGTATLDLASVVYQNPQPWPYAGNCAVTYIADYLDLPSDFRSAYSNEGIDWDSPANWPTNVPYPTSPVNGCNSFPSKTDYATIQTELQNETGWVMGVRGFIANLGAPFQSAGGSTIVSQVAENIYQSVQPPSTSSTSALWTGVFDLAAAAGAVLVPEASPELGLLAASGTIAVDVMSSSTTANPAKQIVAEAVNLSSQLYAQTQAHLAALGNLNLILVSDYGKLSAVGTGVKTTYAISSTTDMTSVLNATTQQIAYSALLPPTWPLVQCKPDLVGLFNSSTVNTPAAYFFGGHPQFDWYINAPFSNALPENIFSSWFQLTTTGAVETSTIEAWTFGNFDINKEYASVPTTAITGSLFSTGPGGGAAYPPAWYRSTYNPPNFVRCGGRGPNLCTEQHSMPTIGPTPAGYTLN